jgi:RimJ/RimL family protein N-acetyltransferase
MTREAALRALRVRTPRLELRLPSREELLELAEVARAGIHPPERMPFYVPWSDRAPLEEFPDEFVAHHEGRIAGWDDEAWSLGLVAFHEGRPVGEQSLRRAGDVVDTGSWLGAAWQNRGLGFEMRAGALELAFRGLGFGAATSGAFVDNPQSQRVSEKLGYRVVGRSTHAPRGKPVEELKYRLERDDWRCPVAIELHGVDAVAPFMSRSNRGS